MTQVLILLDSTTLQGSFTTDDFQVPIDIDISDCRYEIALVKLNLWYSWYNISTDFGNNTLRYSPDGGTTWKTITIPNGQYTVDQINTVIQSAMFKNGDYYTNAQNVTSYNITISADYSTLKVNIAVSSNFQVDLTVSALNLLLGFGSIIVTYTQEGSLPANINRDINSLSLKCSISVGSFSNNNSSNILYTFVPTSIPGTNLNITPKPKLIFLPVVNTNRLTSIRITIVDNLGRRVDLNNQPVTCLLVLRKMRKTEYVK
jgi:hypothetical protein